MQPAGKHVEEFWGPPDLPRGNCPEPGEKARCPGVSAPVLHLQGAPRLGWGPGWTLGSATPAQARGLWDERRHPFSRQCCAESQVWRGLLEELGPRPSLPLWRTAMQGPRWAWPSISTSVTTSARQRVSWGRRVRGEVKGRAVGSKEHSWKVGGARIVEEAGQGGPWPQGDDTGQGVHIPHLLLGGSLRQGNRDGCGRR